MKKLLVLLPFLLSFLLSGCVLKEIDRGYLVNTIGFSTSDGDVKIFIEAISSPDNLDKPSNRVVLTARGSTVQNAFENLSKNLVKPLYFEQLGAAILEKDETDDAVTFLKELPNVNYGIYLVKTDDLSTLFSADTPNGILGYDIIGLLKTNQEKNNRLYNVTRNDFNLPTIILKDDKLEILK